MLDMLNINGSFPWIETVHALMACNAGTELTCISNIDEHVKMQNMPVLPYLLQRWELITSVRFFQWKDPICLEMW